MFFDNETVYLCLTELFEIELIICIKMDLALNKLQRLMCHKTQTTNHHHHLPYVRGFETKFLTI